MTWTIFAAMLIASALGSGSAVASQLTKYAEAEHIVFYINPDNIKLVVRGQSLVHVTTRGEYKHIRPDGASHFLSTSLLDCNREYSKNLSWRTFTYGGTPLQSRQYAELEAAIDEALDWLADPSSTAWLVADDLKRLCGVVSEWLHQNASSPELPVLRDRQRDSGPRSIPLSKAGGVFIVRATVNGELTLPFVLDSGAADVTLPEHVGKTLFATGALTQADVIGSARYVLADGSSQRGTVVQLRTLSIGPIVLKNVRAAILPGDAASLLLGQTALQKLGRWRIDSLNSRLEIESR